MVLFSIYDIPRDVHPEALQHSKIIKVKALYIKIS